jgi:segregation and condensation protein A
MMGQMTTSHFVRLDQFEGPLDLLLHLVKMHELNIFDIDLHVLIVQYLEYLRMIQFRDLQDAAAFMEMAASLCGIKSRHLLPGADQAALGGIEENGLDSKDNLQKRLFDYQTFSQAGEHLGHLQGSLENACTGHEWRRLENVYEGYETLLRGDVSILVILYEQMLTTLPDRRPVSVKAMTEAITVEEVLEKIESYSFFCFKSYMPNLILATNWSQIFWLSSNSCEKERPKCTSVNGRAAPFGYMGCRWRTKRSNKLLL